MARTRPRVGRAGGYEDEDEDADENADQENEEEEVTEQEEKVEEAAAAAAEAMGPGREERGSGGQSVWWYAEGFRGGPRNTGGRGCRPSCDVSPANVTARSGGRVTPSFRAARFL